MSVFPQARFRFYGSPGNYLTASLDVLAGRVTKGDYVERLETSIAQKLGVAHALCMPQGRFGLYLALREIIKPGQNVILSPYTIYDVVNMVLCAGGRPLFADIDPVTCNIDTECIARLINGDTGAVLVTHLHGLACEIQAVAELCQAKRIPLVEDAAQSFGGRVNGRALGTFGTAGIFSFGRVKNLNGFFGGMVVTNDDALHARMAAALAALPLEHTARLVNRMAQCMVTDIAMSPPTFQMLTFWLLRAGCLRDIQMVNKVVQTEDSAVRRDAIPDRYLRRMMPMQAHLVLNQLARVEEHNAARIAAAAAYHAGLSDIPQLRLPPLRRDGSHIYLAYPIQVADRWGLVKHMMRRGRDVSIQHIGNTADLPIFSEFARDCPNARLTADSVVLLPTYPGYRRSQIEANVRAIRDYYGAPAAASARSTNNWLAPSRKRS